MVLVQYPAGSTESGLQRQLLERAVRGLGDGVGRKDLALEQLCLEAAQCGHPGYLAVLGDDGKLVEPLPQHDLYHVLNCNAR